MSISKDLVDVIRASNDKETKPYDSQATVTRVEGSTVWVHIPGGVDETPVKRTVNAKEGDVVQVRVAGGSAYLLGNASAPPTDDTTALLATEYAKTANMAAESAVQSAKTAGDAAAEAVATAESVRNIAVEAKEHADDAKEHADAADASAKDAGRSANTALAQLSVVEDVVGTLNWISEHGTYSLTEDSEVVPGKVYFTRSGSEPYVYTPVPEPKKEELGSYYELSVDEAVSTYIAMHLSLTEEGLYVMSDKTKWKVLITNDGVYIIDDKNNTVAKYKDVITLGNDDGSESYIQLDYHSMQMKDKEGDTYFHVSDLRKWEYVLTFDTAVDSTKTYYELTGTETYTEVRPAGTENPRDEGWYEYAFVATMTETSVKKDLIAYTMVTLPAYSVKSVKINGRTATATKISGYLVYHTPIGAIGDEITITYTTDSEKAKAYTLGKRGNGNIGALSIAEGSNTIAGGTASHAEGANTVASDNNAHAEGDSSKASNRNTHAEGYASEATGLCSHAEGMSTYAKAQSAHSEGQFTYATGLISHAEGFQCTASGESSHAQNVDTIAGYKAQTAIGKYNDNQESNAFEIGNGTAFNERSNAFAVDWDGIPYCRNKKNEYDSIFNLIYPVGSIYMAVNNISPATLFGGTWEQIKDRFLLSAGDTYGAGGTGGSADASLPAHTHTVSGTAASNGAHTHTVSGTAASNGAHTHGMGSIWSDGSGSASAYTMSTNRKQKARNTTSAGAHTHTVSGTAASNGAHTHTVSGTAASQGVDAKGKNMPPYLTVYMWKRTA